MTDDKDDHVPRGIANHRQEGYAKLVGAGLLQDELTRRSNMNGRSNNTK